MKYWVLHKKRLNRKPGAVSKLRKAARARRRAYDRQTMYLVVKGWLTDELRRVEREMMYGMLAEVEQAKETTK